MRRWGIGAEAVVFPGMRATWTAEFRRAVVPAQGRQGCRAFFGKAPGLGKGWNAADHFREHNVAAACLMNSFFHAPADETFLNVATGQINHEANGDNDANHGQDDFELRSGDRSLRAQEKFGEVFHVFSPGRDGLWLMRDDERAQPGI